MKKYRRDWDYDEILEHGNFKPTDDVLETGAMWSFFSLELSPKVHSITVTDSWAWANRKFVGEHDVPTGLEWATQIGEGVNNTVVAQAEIEDLGYDDASFDKVVCISAIEHVENDRKGIEEMMRVLKPGGLLLLTTEYNPDKPDKVFDADGTFYRIYDHKGIEELVKGYNLIMQEVASTSFDSYTTLLIVLQK
jgi:SAM-dependent methyltransferase